MPTERIAQLQRLLAVEPDDAFCHYGIAQEYAKLGRFDEAIAHYDRAIAADPDYCYAYYHKARVHESDGETDAAVATARDGLARAQAVGDAKAIEEITALLDSLT